MTAREFDSHAEFDEIRCGVLGALARGMSMSYAARADGISLAQAEQIATEAGWPDQVAVYREWRRLREISPKGLPAANLVGTPGVETRPPEPPTKRVPRRPTGPRLDLSVARIRSEGVAFRQATTVTLDDQGALDVVEFDSAKPETYPCAQPGGSCGCVGTGAISCPGQEFEAEDDPAHGVDLTAATLYEPDHPQSTTCGILGNRCGPTEDDEALIASEEVLMIPAEAPLARPAETPPDPGIDYGGRFRFDTPAEPEPGPEHGQVPCEVCGVGVLRSYVKRTGRQRHGHHPADA